MSLLYSDFRIPQLICYVSKVFFFKIVEPQNLLVQIAQSRPFKKIIKAHYVWNTFETVPCFCIGTHAYLYRPQVGHFCLPEELLFPILVFPGEDLLTVAPLGLRVLVVVILTVCFAIFSILPKTEEHTRIVTNLK